MEGDLGWGDGQSIVGNWSRGIREQWQLFVVGGAQHLRVAALFGHLRTEEPLHLGT